MFHEFQSPSLRGSGRFRRGARRRVRRRRVSIPFIAGQWSLPLVAVQPRGCLGEGFNPLHCGAVVASSLF